MKHLKIIHVNDIAYVGYNFVEALNILGHDARLLCLRLPGATLPDYQKLIYIPARIKELISINQQIIAGGYDIVHLHYGYLGALGAIGRYPYFLHIHGGDVREVQKDFIRWLPTRAGIKRSKKCFFVTPDLAKYINFIRSDGIFLPNPICTDRFKPNKNGSTGGKPPRILIISALSPNKGVSIAFEAIKMLQDDGYNFRVSAISLGTDKEKYIGFPGVDFLPEIPYIDKPDMNIMHDYQMANLINNHDIILGQLLIGSLGLAELEAMSCAKPVVSYVNNYNYYPEPAPVLSATNASEVAANLANLIDNPKLREELGNQGREWVIKYHDYITVTKQALKIYGL